MSVYSAEPIKGFIDDYAFLIKGLLDLYEASLDSRWLKWASELQHKQNELFWDDVHGGYYTSAGDANLVLKLKEGNYITGKIRDFQIQILIRLTSIWEVKIIKKKPPSSRCHFNARMYGLQFSRYLIPLHI